MDGSRRKILFLNTLGGLGYLSAVLQWLWALTLYLPLALSSDVVQRLREQTPTATPTQPMITGLPPTLQLIFGLAITAIFIVIAIMAVSRLPASISKGGRKITHGTAQAILPIVTRHHPLPEKKRLVLGGSLIFALKLAASLIPLIAALMATTFKQPISGEIIATVSIYLYAWTLTYFGLQAILAKLLRISYRKLR